LIRSALAPADVKVVLFNKPYGVICQFSPAGEKRTLKEFVPVKDVYPVGRLDTDSEGLLLLTNDGALQNEVSRPDRKWPKSYWAQVENSPDEMALARLRNGVDLKEFVSAPATVNQIAEPDDLWMRSPPIRTRRNIATSWLDITLTEGKNRQIRRMTAAVGLPTLRLIRYRIGPWTLSGLAPGSYRVLPPNASSLAGRYL